MEITFIMGNGFDIGAGLKTKYSDFYTYLLNQKHPKNPGVALIVKSIKSGAPSQWKDDNFWSDFELGIGEYASNFTPAQFKKTMSGIGLDSKKYDPMDVYMQGVTYVQNMLGNYLRTINKSCTKQLTPFGHQMFAEWITDPAKHLKLSTEAAVRNICNYYSGETWKVSFLSLNYTDLLNQCISDLATQGSIRQHSSKSIYHSGSTVLEPDVRYIHGTTACQICGVGNRRQIRNKRFRLHSSAKSLIKKNLASGTSDTFVHEYPEVESVINSSQLIYIYGASLGKTDIWLWSKIGQWLQRSNRHHLFIYDYTADVPASGTALHRRKEDLCKKFRKNGGNIRRAVMDRICVVPFGGNDIVCNAWFQDIATP